MPQNKTCNESEEPRPGPTDYGAFVVQMLARSSQSTGTIDQKLLRHCLNLSSSFLMTDTTMNPSSGLVSWNTGFSRLVDVLMALHAQGELELGTLNAASKACSECWSIAGTWRGLENVRQCVKVVAVKLQSLLDENRTYKGSRVYAP